MNLSDIRERSRELGLSETAKLKKAELIRTIQRAEGNPDCFGAPWRFDCQLLACCWRQDCLTKNPG